VGWPEAVVLASPCRAGEAVGCLSGDALGRGIARVPVRVLKIVDDDAEVR